MSRRLKQTNRVLLEMITGLFVYGLLCQILGLVFVPNKLLYSLNLWVGVFLAVGAILHLYRTLDRSLGSGSAAVRMMTTGYLIRYLAVAVVAVVLMQFMRYYVLAMFLGYFGMKICALTQPFTHKFYNAIWHETDPIPQAMPEETSDPEVAISGEPTAETAIAETLPSEEI